MARSASTNSFNALLHRLQTTIKMPPALTTLLAYLFSWRTLCLLLALLNLKNLPFSWHVRLFNIMYKHNTRTPQIRQRLRSAAAALPPTSSSSSRKPVHPIFRPQTLTTHAPAYECDYNLHKSNSTYFSDLDLSRGKLIASLIGPALNLNALVPHGVRKGLTLPILGAVHTSFLREIKPYETYDVRSRVLGWDRKWLVIGSWFVRRATAQELQKDQTKNFLKGPVGEKEVVFACVLNKYVIKAGRLTVPPELCFAGSGWFPVRPEATATIRAYQAGATGATGATGAAGAAGAAGAKGEKLSASAALDISPSAAGTGTVTPALGPDKIVDGTANMVQNVAMEAGRRLSMSQSRSRSRPKVVINDENHDNDSNDNDDDGDNDDDASQSMPGWSWDEIEAERKRGLKIAEMWLRLDTDLRSEYEDDVSRGILQP